MAKKFEIIIGAKVAPGEEKEAIGTSYITALRHTAGDFTVQVGTETHKKTVLVRTAISTDYQPTKEQIKALLG